MPPATSAACPPAAPAGKLAAQTERLYAGDWAAFQDWTRAMGKPALPAAADTVAHYLAALAGRLGPGSRGRRLAAIGHAHRRHGAPWPPDPTLCDRRAGRAAAPSSGTPGPDTVLPRARRRPPAVVQPGPQQLVRLAKGCPGDTAGLRDRALLLLAASDLGRQALVGLDVEQLRFTADAVELLPGPNLSPGSDPGPGHGRAGDRAAQHRVGRSAAACPVRALQDWLEASATRFGPVFRKVDRWGNIEHHRLGADALRRILARRTLRRAKATG